MSVQLKGKRESSLTVEMNRMSDWYNSTLPPVYREKTVADFYEKYIEPRLPDPNIVIAWTKLLLQYVNEEDAVYSIRIFANTKSMKTVWEQLKNGEKRVEDYDEDTQLCIKSGEKPKGNPYVLRRGFLTEFTDKEFTYFFNDNFFAHYFLKMAYDGFVPTVSELKKALKVRTFSARFGKCHQEEIAKAGYDIQGKLMKNPCINHYVAHIVDAGKDYKYNKKTLGLENICDSYFPRGNYDDWKDYKQEGWGLVNQPASNLNIPGLNFVRKMKFEGGLEYLKAHFLRFTCPINYFLVPLESSVREGDNSSPYIKYGHKIGELTELQEYVMAKFSALYGNTYVDYLKAIMWEETTSKVNARLENIKKKEQQNGRTVIDLEYAPVPLKLKEKKPQSKSTTIKTSKKAKGTTGNSTSRSSKTNSQSKTRRRRYIINGTGDYKMYEVIKEFVIFLLAAGKDLAKIKAEIGGVVPKVVSDTSNGVKLGSGGKKSHVCPIGNASTIYITSELMGSAPGHNFVKLKDYVNKKYPKFQIKEKDAE